LLILAACSAGLNEGRSAPQGIHSANGNDASGKDLRLVLGLQSLIRRPGGPPGAIVVIQRGAERSVYRVGLAAIGCGGVQSDDCGDVRLPRADDHMRIASVSKAFSGAAALALVTDGFLSLDDMIGELLPHLPRAWHRVTLRQLLNHTSGLPDFTESAAFVARVLSQPTQPPAPRQLLAFVASRPLKFPPGSRYQYSNSDNIVVGLMTQAVTGTNYSNVLQQTVSTPVHLKQTSLNRPVDLPSPYIHGYLTEVQDMTDVSESVAFGGYAWASGGIVSTPNDISRFVRAYVAGRLFGKAERAEQFRFIAGAESEPPGPGTNSAGLALFRYRTRCGTVYGHTGSILGYTQLIAATDDGQTSITFSVNTQFGKGDLPVLRQLQELAVCVALGR
jgi:D-alanyl-D-alanine carboxypeptidase